MKSITIPERFGYPTVNIEINNKTYTLKSGEEITVDDHVAEVIENAIALAPKQGRNISRLAQLAEGSITELTKGDLEGIETIVSSSFSYCRSLISVEIPNGVTRIGTSAFYSCGELESVRFGDNIKLESIGGSAFECCEKLVCVYLPTTPPTLANNSAFANINASCVFYCKTQAILNAYKTAPIWSTLTGTYTFKVEE